jgi:hypothetical protein
MTYYCFLCNENHDDSPTKEHFIPRSIDGPEDQWLPVCEASNTRSNSIFDNDVRDILYMARHQNTQILKRTGGALLSDGTLKRYKFSYDEPRALRGEDAFHYFYDNESNTKIPSSSVYAIKFSVGLDRKEQRTFCRGLAKMSIGALAYLLRKEGIQSKKIKRLFSQTSIDSMRRFALKLPRLGSLIFLRFSLGQTDVLLRLQSSCENPLTSNHVIEINFQEKKLFIEGMLYSKYGWRLGLSNNVFIDLGVLRLENAIPDTSAPEDLRDLTLSPNSICISNPYYKGQEPTIPLSWEDCLWVAPKTLA